MALTDRLIIGPGNPAVLEITGHWTGPGGKGSVQHHYLATADPGWPALQLPPTVGDFLGAWESIRMQWLKQLLATDQRVDGVRGGQVISSHVSTSGRVVTDLLPGGELPISVNNGGTILPSLLLPENVSFVVQKRLTATPQKVLGTIRLPGVLKTQMAPLPDRQSITLGGVSEALSLAGEYLGNFQFFSPGEFNPVSVTSAVLLRTELLTVLDPVACLRLPLTLTVRNRVGTQNRRKYRFPHP